MSAAQPSLILASGSKARQEMLRESALKFTVMPADIDEDALRQAMGDISPDDIAAELARAKALNVAARNNDALVIGSDQILVCDGEILSKAADVNAARNKLKTLRGKTHRLISAVCVARGDEILFAHAAHADLTMKNFDDDFLEDYISRAGGALTSCVGAYALEAHGADLFSEVNGDYHVILGMPRAPLLEYLKTNHQDLS